MLFIKVMTLGYRLKQLNLKEISEYLNEMSVTYRTFAEVSEHYTNSADTAVRMQRARLMRLSTTAMVLGELIGDVPNAVEGSTGITIKDVIEGLEKKGVPPRSKHETMPEVREVGLWVGLKFYLERKYYDPEIRYVLDI